MYLQALSVIGIPVQLEWRLSNYRVGLLTTAMLLGMLFGASFWGLSSDMYGRRPAFMCTLAITAVFALSTGINIFN